MASIAHCLYCFEVLASSLENRRALDLNQVEELWARYIGEFDIKDAEDEEDEAEMTEDEGQEDGESFEANKGQAAEPSKRYLRPREISRLQAPSPASASSSSTPSNASSQTLFSDNSKASSRSSLFSFIRRGPATPEEEHPLFVTWNTTSSRGHTSLRGCIGTFEPHKLSKGLRSFSLASAFDDVRFSPIALSELQSLSNSTTLLMNFTPCEHPLDWILGQHGLRISFTYHGKRYGSTYLPNVAPEQGWNKEETMVSLMRKAGWSGRSSEWRKVSDLKCIRYEGSKEDVTYRTWKDWRYWVESETKAS